MISVCPDCGHGYNLVKQNDRVRIIVCPADEWSSVIAAAFGRRAAVRRG